MKIERMWKHGKWEGLLGVWAIVLGCSGSNGASDNGQSDGGGHNAASGGSNPSSGGGSEDGGTGPGSGGRGPGGEPGGSGGTSSGSESAKELAAKLGRDHFLIGMGNDLEEDHNQDGAYTLGVTMDLHYAYLVGLPGEGGWVDWNPGGYFVDILAEVAASKGVVPMFTLYQMAAWGELNLDAPNNPEFMEPYWEGVRILFERLGEFDAPAVVHFEPDFWGFAQQHGAPDELAVQVKIASDCGDLPDNLAGMGRCLVKIARKYAPKTLIGFHASSWADPNPESIAQFLIALGAREADMVVADMLDRDAGCFEVGNDPNCWRTEGGWYWDETNRTHPNFHDHLDWARGVIDGVGLPMLWWQLPFGVPSDTPGGTPGHYRDNRVKYVFEHIDEFIAVGGLGATFGVGAANQTYIDTDGDQFKNAVTAYFAAPRPL